MFPNIDPQHLKAVEIFQPYAFRKLSEAVSRKTKFVHYTSASAALSIFRNRQVWMRNACYMNDYREIEHGIDCLIKAYREQKDRVRSILNGMFDGFTDKLEAKFNAWLPEFRFQTYIVCISEHDALEDELGRLSMWRAYGGATAVAIVVDGSPFLMPSDALRAHTHPIMYSLDTGFNGSFSTLLDGVEANREFVAELGEEQVESYMFEAFRAAALCTKHVGFREELEWRIIYNPNFSPSERLFPDVECIFDTPQNIHKIPLRDVPDEGLSGIEIPQLVQRVIVGPSKFPWAIRDAFVSLLEKEGVVDAASRVCVSDIPLRH